MVKKFILFIPLIFSASILKAGEVSNDFFKVIDRSKIVVLYHMDGSTCCIDSSTNGVNANLQGNGNATVTGAFNNGIYFNGSGTAEVTGLIRKYRGFSICAYLAPDSSGIPSDRRNIFALAGAGNMGMYQFGNKLECNNDNNAGCSEQMVTTITLATGTYQAVCVVRRDGYRTEGWIQTNLGMQFAGSVAAASCDSLGIAPFYIASQNGSVNFYKGKIDELIFTKEELTPGQIAYYGRLRNPSRSVAFNAPR